jgi:CubicO group peptidase (beta-lactamase class C family)/enterochelin esterase-like enzyme
MSRLGARVGALLAAAALVAAGVSGAYSYARNYYLHRGFSTLVQLPRAGTGRLEAVHFYSPALHRSAVYLVYLPPHYTPHRRYPVYYLLHGMPGQPMVFVNIANMDVRLDNQLTLGHARPMILVYPDGRIGGSVLSDSEWANTRAGAFESYVLEVVHSVDQRFATIPRRQDRVIAGFSSGAYGAINIALHHLADFADVQTWSGYFTQTPTGVFAHAGLAPLAYNSPLDYVRRLRAAMHRYPLRVYMFVGRDDSSSRQQLPMARALQASGAQLQYRFYAGGHDWSVWYPRLNQMLDLASRDVAHPPTAGTGLATRGDASVPPAPAVHQPPARRSSLRLIAALLLALVSAALINLGFVLQHRGHAAARAGVRGGLAGGFRQPAWLLGQAVGWIGFAGQIVAVALAPLTLVQAFSAGSLALSVPLAARVFGHRVARRQLAAIVLIAVSLASLPLGFGEGHAHLYGGLLVAAALFVMLTGGLLAPRGGATALAVAAGAFYGVADGAIKAASIALRFQGAGILTGWTLLVALCTLGGFLAFQAALQKGDAVQPLSLMNAFTALAATALGIAAFGERLGSSPATGLLHAAAIVVVLACVRPLAGAQQRLVGDMTQPAPSPSSVTRSRLGWRATVSPRIVTRGLAGSFLGTTALIVGSLGALGLLYGLRQMRWFAVGPRVSDALPLLQLAGFDAQPLARMLAAALLAGLVIGWALIRVDRGRRVVLVGVFSLLLMLLGSDASYALARNLSFDQVLLDRTPGLGPWLEAVLLTAGSAVPGPVGPIRLPSLDLRVPDRRVLASILLGSIGAAVAVALVAPSGHAGAQSPGLRLTGARQRNTRVPRMSPAKAGGAASAMRTRQFALNRVLDAALRTNTVRIHAPAATAAVVACGRVVGADATGVLDVHSKRSASDGSLFVLNSAAKIVVATMIMQEIQDGRLSLATRLSDFYPQLPNADRISVRMLLDMTSGLPDYLQSQRIEWMIRHRPRHRWTVDQVLTGLGAGLGSPKFPPGHHYQYSDTNYIALGGILERITHSSIQRDFQRLITKPLGITSATFVPTPAAEKSMAHPYLLQSNGTLTSQWIPGFGVSSAVWGPVFTDGGLASSSLDLAQFANALLGGRLVSTATVKQMTHLVRGQYGFGIRSRSFDGHFWLGQAGIFGGFQAQGWSDPSRQLTIAIATNVQKLGGGLTSDRVWWAIARAYDRQNLGTAGCRSPTTR